MKKKVGAFTILEMTVTMLIAGLLIAITYTSYFIIAKSYQAFTGKNDNMLVLVTLDHVLARDFDRAELVLKETDGIILKNETQVIKYTFSTDFITRETNKMDTFRVGPQDVNTAFERLPVTDVNETGELNRIDDLDFTLVFQDQKMPYHYHKQYSSDNLINRNPNAGN